jgi:hypothetical protein
MGVSMIHLFLTLWRFLVAFWRSLRDPEFRALFIVFLGLLIGGTGFYSSAEGWSLIDSLYFSVMTLSTVGYGDLSPTTALSKIFTILYVLAGAGIFVAFISKVTEGGLHHRSPGHGDKR